MPPLPGDVQWFPAEIRRLILAIKKQECIYNTCHQEFGLRESQAKAWRAVAELVGGGKTDTQCRDKWNCLRGTYRRHVRTEASNNVKRRSGWPWADMMSFIKRHVMDKDELSELRLLKVDNETKKHKPNCPASQNAQLQNVTVSKSIVPREPPGLTYTGGLLSAGGIIFNTNRVGIGIVQPNQSNMGIGIVQPSKSTVVGGLKPSDMSSNVSLGVVQPVQTNLGVKMVHTSLAPVAPVVAKPVVTSPTNQIQVDLNKVKTDEDAQKSPARTEFVDIDVLVKKEPMEEEEVDISEFNFLSEEGSQDSSQGSDKAAKPNGPTTPEESETDTESNQLFMRSTVSHMRQLSAYDQSVFKLKVQQLLHEMMFPTASRN